MLAQSLAIVALILVMSFMFLRAKKAAWAILALPLLSVSLFYLLGFAFYSTFGGELSRVMLKATGAGLVFGIICCALLMRAIPVKKLRLMYMVGCVLFLIALAIAYANYII